MKQTATKGCHLLVFMLVGIVLSTAVVFCILHFVLHWSLGMALVGGFLISQFLWLTLDLVGGIVETLRKWLKK